MFVGSFCLFPGSDISLNYDEFELTEFMSEEQLKNYLANAPDAEADPNQVA
jgi:hypothetical protein